MMGTITSLAEGRTLDRVKEQRAREAPIRLFPSREQGGVVPERQEDPFIDTQSVAEQAGVTAASVREYLKRSRRRLGAGHPLRPQDLPLPDKTFSRALAWRQSAITKWLSNRARPGRPPISEP